MKCSKKIGIGTLSLILSILGILFAFSFGEKGCFGDSFLTLLGIKAWSNGSLSTHYTVFYSIIFFVPAFILGIRFKEDFGRTLGKIISLIMLLFIFLLTPFMMVSLNVNLF